MVIGSIQASDEYVVINCQWIMYIFGKASEGGGQVVSVQSFYFDEPAEGNKLFLCKILIENNEKEAWGWPT